jgi:hypothetical protein
VPSGAAYGKYTLRAIYRATGETAWRMIVMASDCPASYDFTVKMDELAILQDSISMLKTENSILRDTIFILKTENNSLNDSLIELNQLLTSCDGQNQTLHDSILKLNSLLVVEIGKNSSLNDTIIWLHKMLVECQTQGSANAAFRAQDQLQIYPNPVNGELKIENGASPIGDVKIYDMTGKLVYQKTSIPNSQFSIDMSPFQSGNYILRIGHYMAKVVKQ